MANQKEIKLFVDKVLIVSSTRGFFKAGNMIGDPEVRDNSRWIAATLEGKVN
jgi:hypothetical protein